MPPAVHQPEGGTEQRSDHLVAMPCHRQAAALFQAIECERSDNRMRAGLQRAECETCRLRPATQLFPDPQ
jgi:hypothetical protein